MTSSRSRAAVVAVVVLVAIAWLVPGHPAAQEPFPTRPVTIWVGFPPGGGTDILTRALAESAEKLLGQKVVVINKPGATGVVATAEVVKAKPDGYTLVANTDTPITRAPHFRDLDYDPFRDLTHITRLGRFKLVVYVRADSPHKTWRDLVEWAKKNPGQLTFGHPGAASTPNLVMTKMASKEGISVRGIPFAGDAPMITALLGGHVVLGGGREAERKVEDLRGEVAAWDKAVAETFARQSTESEQHRTLLSNLRTIEAAKEQWTLEQGKKAGEPVAEQAIALLMKNGLPKPVAGEIYQINPVGMPPSARLSKPLGDLPAGHVIELPMTPPRALP